MLKFVKILLLIKRTFRVIKKHDIYFQGNPGVDGQTGARGFPGERVSF